MLKNQNAKIKQIIFIAVTALIIILILMLFLRSCQCGKPPPNINETTESKTLDFTSNNESNTSIIIPGVNGINMKSGQLEQKVDFYNPDENNCLFLISLYLSDDTLIWQSDLIRPSEHITQITLKQKLQRGLYRNCRLVYDCYTLDEKKHSQWWSGKNRNKLILI